MKFTCQKVRIVKEIYVRAGLQRCLAEPGDIVDIVRVSPKMPMPYVVDDGYERYWVFEDEIEPLDR